MSRPPAIARLLITGGAGYLGSHLMQAPGSGRRYATLHRTPPAHPDPDRYFWLDLRDLPATRALFRRLQPQAVIHTALSNSTPQEIEAIPQAAHNVALAAREAGARLVHLSSDMIWDGESAPYAPTAPPAPLTPYARAKARAEALVREVDPGAAIVRPSLIWGLDPPDRQTGWLLAGIRRGERVILFSDEYRMPVYVRSLAAALLQLAAGDMAGPLNMGGAQRLSRWEFGQRLLAALRRLRPDLLAGPGEVVPGLSAGSGLVRPRDLSMNMDETYRLLPLAPLPGVDEVLQALRSEPPAAASPPAML